MSRLPVEMEKNPRIVTNSRGQTTPFSSLLLPQPSSKDQGLR